MKAIVNNTEYKLDKFPFPKRGVQAEGYHLVDDEDGTQLLSRVTRAPSGAYTYVMYGDVSYSFPRHIELPSGTVVRFSEGAVSKTKTKTAPKDVVDDAVLIKVLDQVLDTKEAYPNYLESQLTPEEDPMEKAARFIQEQDTKRGLGQAPTIAEYLPPIKPKATTKPPRKAPTK
jgi:hypothetical protein